MSNPETRVGYMELAPTPTITLRHVDFGISRVAVCRAGVVASVSGIDIGQLTVGAQQPSGRPQAGRLWREFCPDLYCTVSELKGCPLDIASDVRPRRGSMANATIDIEVTAGPIVLSSSNN